MTPWNWPSKPKCREGRRAAESERGGPTDAGVPDRVCMDEP